MAQQSSTSMNAMDCFMGQAVPAEADNTFLAPKRTIAPTRVLLGYLAKIGKIQRTATDNPYHKLTIRVNYGFGIKSLDVNAFSNIDLQHFKCGSQVRAEVLESGQFFNLRGLSQALFTDCMRCEHPIQGTQYDQVSQKDLV